MKKAAYKRVLLKLSGEALLGDDKFGVSLEACQKIANSVKQIHDQKIQIAIVIGGGNIFRGIQASKNGMQRTPADHIGMLATLINGIALQQAFEKIGLESRIMSAITLDCMAESYSWKNAIQYLENQTVLIFVGGTGNPYFSTDSAATLRALEIGAEILLKATKVNGIYNKDPKRYPDAKKYDQITYAQVLAQKLEVMDLTAIALAQENGIPIRVFNMFDHSLQKALLDEPVGTLVVGE